MEEVGGIRGGFQVTVLGWKLEVGGLELKICLARCDIVHVLNFLIGNYTVNINNWSSILIENCRTDI